MNAQAQQVETQDQQIFRVVVNVTSLLKDVLQASDEATSGLSNAMHRFIEGTDGVGDEAVDMAFVDNAKATEDKAKKVRISEIRAVFRAVRSCGLELGNKAYHDVVKEARALLKQHNILPSGKEKQSQEVVEANRKTKFLRKAISDYMDEGKGAVEAAQLAEGAYEQDLKTRQGVPQAQIEDEAVAIVENLTHQGYDHKTIRRILTHCRELLDNMGKTAEPAAK